MAKNDQLYLSLWLQWALARPNSAFRNETILLNHASVPANELELLARELINSAGKSENVGLQQQAARVLLEAARTAQMAAKRREKAVVVKVPLLLPLPAVVQQSVTESELLLEERWLASFCKAERAQGRWVLIYVRQTGTRDIQGRIEAVFKNAGLHLITLCGSVKPPSGKPGSRITPMSMC